MSTKDTTQVFIYDALKQHGELHNVLHRCEAEFLGYATIESKKFVMINDGNYPTLVKVEKGTGTDVYGELYRIPTENLELLDQTEGCPDNCNREAVNLNVLVDDGVIKSRGHVYYVNNTFTEGEIDEKIIESGEWVVGGVYHDALWDKSDEERAIEAWHEDTDEKEFIVERGVYISTDYGEMDGPHESMQAAIDYVEANPSFFTSCAAITIGFRMVRTELSGAEQEGLEYATKAPA